VAKFRQKKNHFADETLDTSIAFQAPQGENFRAINPQVQRGKLQRFFFFVKVTVRKFPA
jgi:hypothetical protein